MREYVISDTHFDDSEIIRLQSRPFSSVDEMNDFMLDSWNSIVRPSDTVYFLGDLAYRGRSTDHWYKRLNGSLIFIKGNHDSSRRILFEDNHLVVVDGLDLFMCHNPRRSPKTWPGWVVHGHSHTRKEFLDRRKRRANVCVEHIEYLPLDLEELVERIRCCS